MKEMKQPTVFTMLKDIALFSIAAYILVYLIYPNPSPYIKFAQIEYVIFGYFIGKHLCKKTDKEEKE